MWIEQGLHCPEDQAPFKRTRVQETDKEKSPKFELWDPLYGPQIITGIIYTLANISYVYGTFNIYA